MGPCVQADLSHPTVIYTHSIGSLPQEDPVQYNFVLPGLFGRELSGCVSALIGSQADSMPCTARLTVAAAQTHSGGQLLQSLPDLGRDCLPSLAIESGKWHFPSNPGKPRTELLGVCPGGCLLL